MSTYEVRLNKCYSLDWIFLNITLLSTQTAFHPLGDGIFYRPTKFFIFLFGKCLLNFTVVIAAFKISAASTLALKLLLHYRCQINWREHLFTNFKIV